MKKRRASYVAAVAAIAILMASTVPTFAVGAETVPTVSAEETGMSLMAGNMTAQGQAKLVDHAGKQQVYKISGNADLHGEITLQTAGRYRLSVSYYLDDSNKRKVEFTGKINGVLTENGLTLPRIFEDEFAVDGEVRPSQLTVTDWFEEEMRLDDYRRGEYLYLDLKAGVNTIDLHFEDQVLWIEHITLIGEEDGATLTTGEAGTVTLPTVTLEAEHASLKSDSSIPPSYDIANMVVSPYQYDKTLLNTIGGSSWSSSGQWIEWEIPVEESGYYQISFRVRQNVSRGLRSYRRISVDGAIPFENWEAYGFEYQRSWYVETLKDEEGDAAYVWLEKGAHTLRMEVVMGQALQSYQVIADAVEQLNTLYRKIIVITGASPDANRSYQLYKRLPVREELLAIAQTLREELARVETDSSGTELSALEQTAVQLENYAADETRLIQNLSVFNSDITALASKLSSLSSQPLELDIIQVASDTNALPATKVGFFASLKNGVLRFIHSFVDDYGAMDTEVGENGNITVWVMTGRDQSQVLRDMVNDSFTPTTGITVQLSLATAGFNEAVMSGRGPDVCIGTERTNVINLGVRGVLCDLSQFETFAEVKERFQKTAFDGYTYEDRIYALPNTQEYNMLFVRTDIYEELELEIPQTWAQLQGQVAILGRYNMQAGIPSGLYLTLLLQNGMTYYADDLRSTVLGTVEAYEVYTEFAKFFTDYQSPISYNAQNRFRSGEMPVLISAFSFYNTFSLLAPELNGKWAMYEIPGTMKADGTIDRSTSASGTASVIVADTASPEAAFAFLDWWSTTESQARFCREIEDILGPSGRYATANVEAFDTTNWSSAQRVAIQFQREWVWEIPETPVSYIIDRNLNNLFVNVVNNGAQIRESMLKYERIIQSEMDRKYKELRLYKENSDEK